MEPGWGVQLHVFYPTFRIHHWIIGISLVEWRGGAGSSRWAVHSMSRWRGLCAIPSHQGTFGVGSFTGCETYLAQSPHVFPRRRVRKGNRPTPVGIRGAQSERQFLYRTVEAGLSIQIVVSPPYGRYSCQSEFAGFSSEGGILHCVPCPTQTSPRASIYVCAKVWQLQCSFLPGKGGLERKLGRLVTACWNTDRDEPLVLHQGGVPRGA